MDPKLTSALVVLALAAAGSAGVEVTPEESASILELALQALASIAGLYAVARGIALRRAAKDQS